MKISLGTVQFGSAYGSFNTRGQVSLKEVTALLCLAKNAGIVMLDTARAYGVAEEVLASVGAPSRFDIITKCPDLSVEIDPVQALKSAFETSLNVMGVNQIYGYLLHNAENILIPGVFEFLKDLRDSGRVKGIGVSGYEAQKILDYCVQYTLNIVQLPANILDPWYERIIFPDYVELHVRSVFLQGFLLANPVALPEHLMQFSDVLTQFQTEALAQKMTPLQAALSPLLASHRVGKVVVGADSLGQLSEILEAEITLRGRPAAEFGPYKGVTSNLIDPRKWRISL